MTDHIEKAKEHMRPRVLRKGTKDKRIAPPYQGDVEYAKTHALIAIAEELRELNHILGTSHGVPKP